MDTFNAFVCYSHIDKSFKEEALEEIKTLEEKGEISIWDDNEIRTGNDWQGDIEEAISFAHIAILFISENFFGSEYIRDVEIPSILKRNKEEHLRIFPIITRPCSWEKIPWIEKIQVCPTDYALSEVNQRLRKKTFLNLVKEIHKYFTHLESDAKKNILSEESYLRKSFFSQTVKEYNNLIGPILSENNKRRSKQEKDLKEDTFFTLAKEIESKLEHTPTLNLYFLLHEIKTFRNHPDPAKDIMDMKTLMNFSEVKIIEKKFQEGKIVPFLGPGRAFHHCVQKGPEKIKNLAEVIASIAMEENTSSELQDILINPSSQKKGKLSGRLLKFINFPQEITPLPSLVHRFLATMKKPMLILSISYDTLLEEAFLHEKKNFVVVTFMYEPKNPSHIGKWKILQYSSKHQYRSDEKAKILTSEQLVKHLDWPNQSIIFKIGGLVNPPSDFSDGKKVWSEFSEEKYKKVCEFFVIEKKIPDTFLRVLKNSSILYLEYFLDTKLNQAILGLTQDPFQDKWALGEKKIEGFVLQKEISPEEKKYWKKNNVSVVNIDPQKFIPNIEYKK